MHMVLLYYIRNIQYINSLNYYIVLLANQVCSILYSGITVLGGENSKRLDLGIYVKSITDGGPAAKDGRLKAGKSITIPLIEKVKIPLLYHGETWL